MQRQYVAAPGVPFLWQFDLNGCPPGPDRRYSPVAPRKPPEQARTRWCACYFHVIFKLSWKNTRDCSGCGTIRRRRSSWGRGRVRADHAKWLRELQADHPETGRRIVVSLDPHDRTTEDGIELLHHATFLQQLWHGALF